MKMKNKVTLVNMISSLALQICTIISGFIIPKIILSYFGSDTNGLISSLNQFLSYISLLEGGVTGVVAANLYKPLVNGDNQKLSAVVVTSKKFFNKVGAIFVAYTFCLAIVYPLVFEMDFWYVFFLTVILSMNLLVQYMFSITLRTLLNADKKLYIVSFTQIISTILNTILAYVSVKIYPSIHLLKLISGLLFFAQPVIYGRYVRKYYSIDWSAEADNQLLKERWNGFAINLAAFIHNSTDISILTFFTNLATVSIYNIYSLVAVGLKSLVQALTSGISATIGHAYAREDWDELNQKMDLYEYIVFLLVSFLFTVGALLITPFVMLYTSGIYDADYNQPLFGILLLISEALYIVKYPHLNLSYDANKFKEITKPAFVEALINIVVSVALVGKLGLVGIAIGTTLAMIYRMGFHVYFTSTIVKNRPQKIFYKKLALFASVSVFGVFLCHKIFPISSYTIKQWLIHAIDYSIILGLLYLVISLLFFKKELLFFKSYLKK